MELQIVSPEAELFSGEVESVTIPGKSGSFQILNNHAPIVSTLVSGNVIIKGNLKLNKDQKEKFIQEGNQTILQIQSGAIELNANKAILLVD
tara:strand:- start:16310 stop:16585 length:276 start_codon:yes stop_codon:yes gene_type:complete